ncbi:M56 family metallopeptidase [Glycomyces tenuis]|uniref:M56 family metallopeptidase n=1 Tax=Glycomyces tenuis TaxID=58116 RepID=UPI000410E953|nr:M56 family metallopeptidase [Glycomyces tenuis]
MTIAAILLTYAAVLAVFGPRLLRGARLLERAPRLGLVAWFAMMASALLSVPVAGLAMLMPMGSFGSTVAGFLHTCVAALQSQYGPSGGLAAAVASAALVAVVPVLITRSGVAVAVRTRRERREHRGLLARRGRWDEGLGAWIVDRPEAAAYCLAGRGGTVVVTAGAVAATDETQLAAVLAHERAHLAGRHHLLIATALALHRVAPRLPLFADAPGRIAHLIERCADEAASRAQPRRAIAAGLLAFAEAGAAPQTALAVSGGDTVERMERLLSAPPRVGRLCAGGIVGGSALVVVMPIIVSALPVLALIQMACYPA